ncbi:MAG: dihydroneopterin aldolase [Pseudomonadota bacterium]
MTDTVLITGLRLPTVIGVYDWEREVRQELRVDLEMAWNLDQAAASDDVEFALNYAAVSERLIAFARESSFKLIEAFADAAASVVMNEFNVSWLKLRLAKPGAVAEADWVGLTIERGTRAP